MNKRARILVAVLGSLAFFSQAWSQNEIFDPTGLVSRNGTLVTIATGFSFTEGPAVDRHGNVFFTDQPNDRIYRWDAVTGKVTLFLEGTGRANGMIFDRDGNLIAAADMYGELWKIRPDGSHKVLIDNYQGKLLNGPNDVWINPNNGGMYITDPIFPRGYWDAGRPAPAALGTDPLGAGRRKAKAVTSTIYLPAPERFVRVTSDALGWESDAWPNGVVGTPDGKKLYVNKWYYDNKGGTWVFDIKRDGTLSNMRKFTDWGGDGMSMDETRQRLHQQW